jgi:hypothetical protein
MLLGLSGEVTQPGLPPERYIGLLGVSWMVGEFNSEYLHAGEPQVLGKPLVGLPGLGPTQEFVRWPRNKATPGRKPMCGRVRSLLRMLEWSQRPEAKSMKTWEAGQGCALGEMRLLRAMLQMGQMWPFSRGSVYLCMRYTVSMSHLCPPVSLSS